MSSSEAETLRDALQDLKEAYLVSIAHKLISKSIPGGEIIMSARMRPASEVIRKLKWAYLMHYLWNKMQRSRHRHR